MNVAYHVVLLCVTFKMCEYRWCRQYLTEAITILLAIVVTHFDSYCLIYSIVGTPYEKNLPDQS